MRSERGTSGPCVLAQRSQGGWATQVTPHPNSPGRPRSSISLPPLHNSPRQLSKIAAHQFDAEESRVKIRGSALVEGRCVISMRSGAGRAMLMRLKVHKTQLELLRPRTSGGNFWGTRHGLAQYDRQKPARRCRWRARVRSFGLKQQRRTWTHKRARSNVSLHAARCPIASRAGSGQ
jgi:hypothetical protein